MPSELRWQDLPPNRREELLRLLDRMLDDRLALADVPAEVAHEHH